ncbi:hypothetical protein C8F01DRAFT_1087359 [Mycena amicta]|nr:hypothetical protein C8F01DRAFT_1087359 [Mycena amicta]
MGMNESPESPERRLLTRQLALHNRALHIARPNDEHMPMKACCRMNGRYGIGFRSSTEEDLASMLSNARRTSRHQAGAICATALESNQTAVDAPLAQAGASHIHLRKLRAQLCCHRAKTHELLPSNPLNCTVTL